MMEKAYENFIIGFQSSFDDTTGAITFPISKEHTIGWFNCFETHVIMQSILWNPPMLEYYDNDSESDTYRKTVRAYAIAYAVKCELDQRLMRMKQK